MSESSEKHSDKFFSASFFCFFSNSADKVLPLVSKNSTVVAAQDQKPAARERKTLRQNSAGIFHPPHVPNFNIPVKTAQKFLPTLIGPPIQEKSLQASFFLRNGMSGLGRERKN